MIKFREWLREQEVNEAKQVGTIYHFTRPHNIVHLLNKSKQEEYGLEILEFISMNGNFSTTFTETDPCTDTAEANYGGNSRYNGSSSTVNFSYTTRNTHYTNMSSKVSKGGTWKCQLLDQLGSPVVGRHIHVTTVRYNNRSQGADLGWFTTDTNGYIETNALTYNFKNEYFGFYPVFDGDSKYVGASDEIWVLYNEAGL